MNNGLKKAVVSLAIAVLALLSVNTTDVYAAAKKFNVTFIYGTKVNTQQVKKGKNAVVPVDTTVPGFTFAGWTDTAANIQCDKVILGMYTPTPASIKPLPVQVADTNKPMIFNSDVSAPALPWWDMTLKGEPGKTCVVRWYNGHTGELWKTEVVPYGTSLDDPANPCFDHYEFIGWRGSWKNITEDRNIEACYFHTNKVTFYDPIDEGIFATFWIRDGETSKTPSVPEHSGYEFTGEFKGSLSNITEDREIVAIYKKGDEEIGW